jgi:hypothetical protein
VCCESYLANQNVTDRMNLRIESRAVPIPWMSFFGIALSLPDYGNQSTSLRRCFAGIDCKALSRSIIVPLVARLQPVMKSVMVCGRTLPY